MAAPLPFPLLGLTMTFLAVSSSTPIVEGSALIIALGIIAYMVRYEGIKRRLSRDNGAIDAKAAVEAFSKVLAAHLEDRPCVAHGEEIVALKRDLGHLRDEIEKLCNVKKKG